jgi:hypothetical protein
MYPDLYPSRDGYRESMFVTHFFTTTYERCGRESNSRIAVLQTAALPLGYRTRAFKLSTATGFLKTTRRITPDIGSRLE